MYFHKFWLFWLFGSLNAEIASDNHCDCPILVAGVRIIHKVQEPRIRSLSSESLGEKWGAWVGGGLDVQIWAFPVLFFFRGSLIARAGNGRQVLAVFRCFWLFFTCDLDIPESGVHIFAQFSRCVHFCCCFSGL